MILLISFLLAFAACESPESWWQIGVEELQRTLQVQLNHNMAKNVIAFVGDGMSFATVAASRILKGQLQGRPGEEGYLHFERFPHSGFLKPYANDNMVSESSASGTALFGGVKANSQTIGLNSNAVPFQCQNSSAHQVSSIMQWAQNAGKATGIVTNTNITDSTPAALYAYSANEDWECDSDIPVDKQDGSCRDIAAQLIESKPGRNINVVMGGGITKFLPHQNRSFSGVPGSRFDSRDLLQEWKANRDLKGDRSAIVTSKSELSAAANQNEFVLGLFAPGPLPFALDRTSKHNDVPTLKEMSMQAVKILSRNPKGFFLVVEAGLIDVAHHKGLAAKALHETLELEDAVEAVDAVTDDSDTLLLVLADHSHAMVFTGYQPRGSPILGLSSAKGVVDGLPPTILMYVSGAAAVANQTRRNISADRTDDKDFHQPAFIPVPWARHLGEDVPVYAKGPMSHLFTGTHELHYVAHAVNYIACYNNATITQCDRK